MKDTDIVNQLQNYAQPGPGFVRMEGERQEIPAGCGCLVVAVALIGYLIFQVVASWG
ncbi:MAG: hypothetical protein U0T75_15430 [Chitinophagales bacterium]